MINKNIKDIKHKDKKLNWLRWLAFGSVGLYLWQVNKKEGKKMGSENPNNFSLHIDKEKMIDMATNVIPISDTNKQFFNLAAKEFLKGFKNKKQEK